MSRFNFPQYNTCVAGCSEFKVSMDVIIIVVVVVVFVVAFTECCQGRTLSMVWKCRKENAQMQDCLKQKLVIHYEGSNTW